MQLSRYFIYICMFEILAIDILLQLTFKCGVDQYIFYKYSIDIVQILSEEQSSILMHKLARSVTFN